MRRPMLILALLAALMPSQVLADAAVPHEDPSAAESRFSGIAIFGYCAQLLDAVLDREPETASTLSEKAPFANTPENLKETLAEFGNAGVGLARVVPLIEEKIDELGVLAGQFRLEEATSLRQEAQVTLNLAFRDVQTAEQAALTFRAPLGVTAVAPAHPLTLAYVEIENRIESIRSLLNLFQGMLDGVPVFVPIEDILRPTQTTFSIDADSAFVGERVNFSGMLTSSGAPLSGRTVQVLVDGVPYAAAQTSLDGSYSGDLRIPYRYVPTLSLRALYYPKDADIGAYLASRSSPVDLDILFYSAQLTLESTGKSYPGREATVRGRFDYGQDPAHVAREVFIYLDGVLLASADLGPEFVVKLTLRPDTAAGPHSIVALAPAQLRYAPADGLLSLDVELFKTTLSASPPWIAFQPASLAVDGSVFTDFGPADGALVEANFGNRSALASTGQDGTFKLDVSNDITFSLIGTERLNIKVTPAEPWNSTARQSWTLVTVNPILLGQLGILMGMLVAVVRVRRTALSRRGRSESTGSPFAPVAAISVEKPGETIAPRDIPVAAAPSIPVLPPPPGPAPMADPAWVVYTGVLEAIRKRTGQVMAVDQTFREFESRAAPAIGNASAYLRQLNLLMEKRYYSAEQLAPAELDACGRLGRLITGSLQT